MTVPSAPTIIPADAGSTSDLQIRTREQFGQLFNSLGLLDHGAEIGVQAGHFSSVLRSTWKGRCLHLIDRWRHDSRYLDLANVSDREHQRLYLSVVQRFAGNDGVAVHRLDSLSAARQFQDGFFDWVYLDADHSYLGCKADLTAWYPKLKIGGVLAGHDFVDGTFLGGQYGVKSAVQEFVRERKIHLYLTEESWKSWYFVKPAPPHNLRCQEESCQGRREASSLQPDGNGSTHPGHSPEQHVPQGSRKLKLYRLLWRAAWWLRDLR